MDRLFRRSWFGLSLLVTSAILLGACARSGAAMQGARPLLAQADNALLPPPASAAEVRSRPVTIDRSQLLDEHGSPLPVDGSRRITLNLFPDVSYTGILEQVQQDGGTITWMGRLDGVPNGQFSIVWTAGVFAGHFASPAGICELSNVRGDLYRVIQIDQHKLPGEGEATPLDI